MLEWLLLAFLSQPGQAYLAAPAPEPRSEVNLISPAPLPSLAPRKLEPKFLNDPYLAVFAQDLESGRVLFRHRAQQPQPIASLSKLMTYLLIREAHDLDDVVQIPYEATQVPGAKVGFYAYERVTVETLLEALLIPSGNDAALALAIYDAGSEADFVVKMNQKAQALGLKQAEFLNASGLDIFATECVDEACEDTEAVVTGNVMTAREAAMLARVAWQDPWFKNTVGQREFYGQSADQAFVHQKDSTNQLLDTFVGSKGIKTGYTALAGQCFINLSEDEAGREILTVVLGSSDRFGETKNLLTWIWDSFEWR